MPADLVVHLPRNGEATSLNNDDHISELISVFAFLF